jgi:hypothetical protein
MAADRAELAARLRLFVADQNATLWERNRAAVVLKALEDDDRPRWAPDPVLAAQHLLCRRGSASPPPPTDRPAERQED